MRRYFVIAAALLAGPLSAQTPADEALAVVERLFAAMHAKDSLAIAAAFDTSALLLGYAQRDGHEFVSRMPVAEFARRIAAIPPETEIEERIWDAEVRVDAYLAQVWTPYAFYVNGERSHCGVDTFILMRFADGWKIVSLADTRRREGCEVPER